MIQKYSISFITALLFLAGITRPAFAANIPDFGTCLNPQTSASQTNTGNAHGVVGYTGTAFSGVDTIYQFSNGNVLQCLCDTNGNGYETKWINANTLSAGDISSLQKDGWEYFADAANWGLNGAYIAKTETYSCTSCTPTPTITNTPTPTPTGTLTPTPTATVTPTPGPEATATPTPVATNATTLAKTGNFMMIFVLFVAGVISLTAGLVLKRVNK